MSRCLAKKLKLMILVAFYYTGKKMNNVIILEDQPVTLLGIESIFKKNNFNVVGTFLEGDQLIDFLTNTKEKIDIAILDIYLPQNDGFYYLNYIKNNYEDIKVLLTSSEITDETVQKAFFFNVDGFIDKYSDLNEIVIAANNLINGKKYFSKKVLEHKVKEEHNDILSRREKEIIYFFLKGYQLKEISSILKINETTISTYKKRVMDKINVKTNMELIKYFTDKPIFD